LTEEKSIEVWLRMYEGQMVHARHHEALRTQATNMVLVVSAALLAFYGSQSDLWIKLGVGVFIFIANLYGLMMSLKHYERSRLHVSVGQQYRNILSKVSALEGKEINRVREEQHDKHSRGSHWVWLRAYVLWTGLHFLLLIFASLVVAMEFSRI
jgi:hypothetical protein